MTSTAHDRIGPPLDAPETCCRPAAGAVLDTAAAERLAGVLKAVAEPTRLRLLSLVAAAQGGHACICDLTDPVGLSQPTVSHHMKILVDAGILEREQRGRLAYFRLVPGALEAATGGLTAVAAGTMQSGELEGIR